MRLRPERRDLLLYLASASWGLGLYLGADNPIHRRWGIVAVTVYAAVAGAVLLLGGSPRVRLALCAAALAGAGVAPMAAEIAARQATSPSSHVQAHTVITEEAALAFSAGEDPYAADYRDTPLGRWSDGVATHFPYMPLHLLLGLGSVAGESILTDARWLFALVGLILVWLALRASSASFDDKLLSFQIVLVMASATVFFPGGHHELPAIALVLLALVSAREGRSGWAGIWLGVAAAMKQTVFVVAPFLALALYRSDRRSGARFAGAFCAVVLPVVVPFVLWNPGAFYEDAVLFPLDLGTQETIARGPTIGGFLLGSLPAPDWAIAAGLIAAVASLGLYLAARRCHDVSQAARAAALVILAAVLLAPTGRAGYLIYPLNLAVWGFTVLRSQRPVVGSPSRIERYA